jgi:transposase
MSKLLQEDIVAIKSVKKKGASNRSLAKLYGVDESTVRYHIKRDGKEDGRKNKPTKAGDLKKVIEYWLENNKPQTGRKYNAKDLWIYLVDNYEYAGSYRSVLRYLDKFQPEEKLRPKRRIETPPGVQAQVDWGTFKIMLSGRLETLYAFVLSLSHSRAFAVIWSRRMDMLSWLEVHNKAFMFLGGIPYVLRIDNLKTGVSSGAGPNATINSIYDSYSRELRFVVDPSRAYTPTDKGKVEAKVKLVRYGINPEAYSFASIEELQRWSDASVLRRFLTMKNPVTHTSVFDAWQSEVNTLQAIPPFLPEAFDCVVSRTVSDDCLVSFEGRQYSVPFAFIKRSVEVRGATEVLIYCDSLLIARHKRHTQKRLVIDPNHYEGTATTTVAAPTPLGRLTKEILSLWDIPVEHRPIDIYERLMEVRHAN